MNHGDTARRFVDTLGDIYDACHYISEMGACSGCPLKHNCLDETPLMQIAEDISIGTFADLLYFADDVENYEQEQDFENYHEWMNAERDRELWAD